MLSESYWSIVINGEFYCNEKQKHKSQQVLLLYAVYQSTNLPIIGCTKVILGLMAVKHNLQYSLSARYLKNLQ
jgi:hypothetical protein